MRCLSCNENDWKNVDEYRLKPSGMSICNSCGFVSYPSRWQSEEDIKIHYRSAYRSPPNASNLFTGQRKTHFHNAFLADVFKEWTEKEIKTPNIFEVGAAYGMALAWFTKAYPGSIVAGSELTTSYRRNAWHEFGIKLEEDFDKTKKHDLIMSYKVAEHQLDVDLRIREYAEALTDGGYLYISVPTWFDTACNFGMPGFDLEYYYSPDHINTWTRKIFESVLQRAGFEIVKKDYIMYDSTYLCKRNDAMRDLPIHKEDPKDIENKLDRLKKAWIAVQENKVEAAIELWPDYPQAWTHLIEAQRKQLFEKGWSHIKGEFIPKMLAACANTISVWVACTDLAMRAKEWKDAIKYCESGLRSNPENPTALQQMMNIMRELALKSGSSHEQIHYFTQARNIARHGKNVSAQHLKEFVDHDYLFNSQLPIPGESVL